MKGFIKFFITLLIAVAVGLLLVNDPGYVLLAYHQWSVETPLWFFLLLLIALYYLVRLIFYLINGLLQLPQTLSEKMQVRRDARLSKDTDRGFMALAEGRWQYAEKCLIRSVKQAKNPLLNYLGAAQAAAQQGELAKRDSYLRLAHRSQSGADVAVGVTQGSLQLQAGQLEQALATLQHLNSLEPRHRYVLQQLKDLYVTLKDWSSLLELLPQLKQRHILCDEDYKALQIQTHSALLSQSDSLEVLNKQWKAIAKSYRAEAKLLLAYAKQLQKFDADRLAEKVIKDHLKHHYDEALVDLYATLDFPDLKAPLKVAESWLKYHGEQPQLLLTLGKLAARNRLWGQAKSYYNTCIAIKPSQTAYQALAQLHQQLNEMLESQQCFAKALALAR